MFSSPSSCDSVNTGPTSSGVSCEYKLLHHDIVCMELTCSTPLKRTSKLGMGNCMVCWLPAIPWLLTWPHHLYVLPPAGHLVIALGEQDLLG